ncbi:MAG TPA: single-stranded DNA-binding protein [Longimicrobiaceae bacterium]|nr:single-stranded DNA-binding protein [Longimicrobiaceae bacterium]
MSRSLNKAIIIGNLGSDPEVRTTGGGSRVAQFSVATSRRWTTSSGEQQEKTEWHRIVCWGKLADIVEKYLKKGQQVYVEGEIQYRQYEDKDGVTKYSTEINARELMMLGGREGGGGGGFGGGGGAPARERATAGGGAGKGGRGGDYDDFQPPPFGDDDDDLPF